MPGQGGPAKKKLKENEERILSDLNAGQGSTMHSTDRFVSNKHIIYFCYMIAISLWHLKEDDPSRVILVCWSFPNISLFRKRVWLPLVNRKTAPKASCRYGLGSGAVCDVSFFYLVRLIPLWKGLLLGCTPRIPNHRDPSQLLRLPLAELHENCFVDGMFDKLTFPSIETMASKM